MISLDAVANPDADRLLSLPALSALAEGGVFCDQVKTVYPTLTYPIHASLLTGCYPSTHGIGHNQPFQPDKAPEMRAWYWSVGDIKAKTLHQAAREKRMDVASILWPVTGKNPYVRRNFPEVLPLPGESAVVKMVRYASPVWILRMELLYGKTRKSILQPDLDDYAALLCEKLYAGKRPPDVLTVHLVDCDSMRHWHGADSPEAHAAMERLDARVGRIVEAVKKAGLLDETLFCVVSDHGQQDAPRGVLLDANLKAACGARPQSLAMGAYIFGPDLATARRVLEEKGGNGASGASSAIRSFAPCMPPGTCIWPWTPCRGTASSIGREKPMGSTAFPWTAPRPARCCGSKAPASGRAGAFQPPTLWTSRPPWQKPWAFPCPRRRGKR
jgi:hypothetical protein